MTRKPKPKTDVKPCPFCGFSDVRFDIEREPEFRTSFGRATCNICGARASGLGEMVFEQQTVSNDQLLVWAKQAWNTRHEPRGADE